ncbi:MAG: hypothetical protein IPH08_15640 [Rhodocyclaceae bacterium]|jgi:signal transduction histidine kinase|nr:hypothetical protein [Rhodocyclaceae bacterium]
MVRLPFNLTMIRLSLRALLVGAVLVVLMAVLISRLREDVVTYQSEARGTDQIEQLYRLINSLQGHRDRSIAWLAGTADRREELLNQAMEVRNALTAVQQVLPPHRLAGARWNEAVAGWSDIDADGLEWVMSENYRRHTEVIANFLALVVDVADDSRLTLDEHIDTYYLQDMVVNRLPALQEVLSHHRALGVLALMQPKFRPQVTEYIRPMIDQLSLARAAHGQTFARLQDNVPELRGEFDRVHKELDERLLALADTMDREFINGRYAITGEVFFAQVSEIVEASQHMAYQTFVPELKRRLDLRVREAQKMMLFVALAVVTAILSLHSLGNQIRRNARELRSSNEALQAENALRRQTEDELRVSMQAAVIANRAKSEFLANLSHEVRTPLNGILGMADLLSMSELDAEQGALLKEMASSGKALKGLLDRIIDFTHIEAGAISLAMDPFAVGSMVDQSVNRYRTNAEAKALTLAAEYAPDLPEIVVGDERRVQQALECLLDNAIKFTDTGSVRIDVSGRVLDTERIALYLGVSDTGIGVPTDKRQFIFDSFTQADGSITRRVGGNGLGLAIARRLAQLMGGSVTLSDREGGGSLFALEVVIGRFADEL